MKFTYTILGILILLSVLFEGIYRVELSFLKEEAAKVKNEKRASDVKLTLYRDLKRIWNLQGRKVNLSDSREIVFETFKGRNYVENFRIASDQAIYKPLLGRIILSGNVKFEKLSPKGRVIETLLANRAVIDLRKNKVYGRGKVILKRGNITLVGLDFVYDTKKGRFIILRDVQTYIGGG